MKKTLKFLNDNIEMVLLCFFGAICLVAVLLQIIARLTKVSLPWTEEVCRYSFIWITFIGMSFAIKHKINISFELISSRLKGKIRIAYNIAVDVLEIIMFTIVLWLSIRFVESSVGRLAPALNISKNIVNVSAPIGVALCIFRLVQDILENCRALKKTNLEG